MQAQGRSSPQELETNGEDHTGAQLASMVLSELEAAIEPKTTDGESPHRAAVTERLEMAAIPMPKVSRVPKRMSRAEMFVSPAGIMSAIMLLPSVSEMDETA